MKHIKQKRRWFSLLLALCMLTTMVPGTVFAAGETGGDSYEYGLCEHHLTHTQACGYTAPVEGRACNHVHDDVACYKETTTCAHTHTDECYPVISDDGEGNVVRGDEPTECTHECSEEGGCTTERVLNCQHSHNDDCGYSEAVEGHECENQCAECAVGASNVMPLGSEASFSTWTEAGASATAEGDSPDYTKNGNTYTIYTAQGLAWLANQVNIENNSFVYKKVLLAGDIDLDDKLVEGYDAGLGDEAFEGITGVNSWNPIGNLSKRFAGTFDGQNHTVSGVKINGSDAGYQGLFGVNIGTIQNVSVTNARIHGKTYVGGVVGMNYGTIDNCHNTGKVSGTAYVGGVVGSNYNVGGGTIANCYNTGDVSATSASSYSGGVVGYNYSTIANCYNTGNVSATGDGSYSGGMAGMNDEQGTIANSYNTGDVSATGAGSYSGGVVGYNYDGTVDACYYLKGCVTGTDSRIGAEKTEEEMTAPSFVDSLNDWVNKPENSSYNYKLWRADTAKVNDGYPVFRYAGWEEAGDAAQEGTDYTEAEDGNTYTICTAQGLAWLANQVNRGNDSFAGKKVLLANDIDLDCGIVKGYDAGLEDEAFNAYINAGNSWNPIGNFSNNFAGTFDGQHHTVSGVKINRGNVDNQGLFGMNSGTIQNVRVTDSRISGKSYVGGVAGRNYVGTIKNCYNTGKVSGTEFVGGVVGRTNGGAIANSYNIGDVSSTIFVGGVAGYNNNGTIDNCYNTGVVSGTNQVGGVVGYNNNGGAIANSYNTGKVSGDAGVGGVAGVNTGTVDESTCYYLSGCVTGTDSRIGTEKTEQDMKAPGFVDLLNDWVNKPENLGYNYKLWKAVNDGYPVFGYAGWEEAGDAAQKGTDYTVEGDTYTICTAQGLAWLANQVNGGHDNFAGKIVLLADDIDLDCELVTGYDAGLGDAAFEGITDGNSWNPIGNDSNIFAGTFDGQNHTVSGVKINRGEAGYQGLFGLNSGTIQNVSVTAARIHGKYFVGGVVGSNYDGGTIDNCHNTGVVSGADYVGGVAGSNDGTIANSYNTGDVSSTIFVGGVVGENYSGTIDNCHNNGKVSGADNVGGVAGSNYSGTIANSYNTGVVSGADNVGGVSGENNPQSTIANCYNTGNVSATGNYSSVGGVVGATYAKIANCYNTGDVSATGRNSYPGGVAGKNFGDVDACYYRSDCVTGTDNVIGTKKTEEEMTAPSFVKLLNSWVNKPENSSYNYKLWKAAKNIDEHTKENGGYPVLRDHLCVAQDGWQSDESSHWKLCGVCGEKVDEADHSGGTATCTNKAICEVCSHAYGAVDPNNHHAKTEWIQDNDKHYNECANGCGTRLNEADCSGGTATYFEQAICEVCGNPYGGTSSHTHTWSDWKYNSTEHWKECSCGAVSEKEAHDWTGWTPIEPATATKTGSRERICQICGHKQIQTIPATGSSHIHSWSDWQRDADNHWQVCSCGDPLSKEAHTWSDWATITAATADSAGSKERTCQICGYKQTEPIPATGKITPATTAPQTGDSSPALWPIALVMLVSGSGLAVLVILRRRGTGKHSR